MALVASMRMLALAFAACVAAPPLHAFCGFFVGKADANLFNDASQVIMVRKDGKTVISMLNNFSGDLAEFALVVPVPQVLQKGQIHVGDKKLFERMDAYSAPRLAEYFDPDPCNRPALMNRQSMDMAAPAAAKAEARAKRELGVTVEAQYTVGEYDIVILSARESGGLETWLRQNGYRIPPGASRALQPYVRQNLKFFVARVNLKEQAKAGFSYLRPLQFAFESEKFMLPIRLGMANAKGPQDLVVFMLTGNGRVETTNYRTVKLPANMDLPPYVKGDFTAFYKAMFGEQAKRESHRVVFTEYFWDMGWCDPCAADPLSPDELRAAGVFWLDPDAAVTPGPALSQPAASRGGGAPVLITRLHVRYTADTFPEDLMFQETRDRANWQARYVLHNPWPGSAGQCQEAAGYFDELGRRQEREAQTLATLTGWDVNDIRARMNLKSGAQRQWWEKLWKQ
jgi:hypothetical protein